MSLVDQYWEIKGGGRKARVACERSLKKPISDDEKETSSEDELDDSEEEALVTRLARRKTSPAAAKTTTARTDSNKRKATSSYQIPAKKTISADKTASTGVTKTTTEQPKSDEDENADEDFSESEIRTNNFRLHHNGWATDAEKVIEVRVVDNGELHGLLKWRDGKLGLYKTSELAERVPHLVSPDWMDCVGITLILICSLVD